MTKPTNSTGCTSSDALQTRDLWIIAPVSKVNSLEQGESRISSQALFTALYKPAQ